MFPLRQLRILKKLSKFSQKVAQELPPSSPLPTHKKCSFFRKEGCLLSVTTSEYMYNANCVISLVGTQ